jgi:hypothetical protein
MPERCERFAWVLAVCACAAQSSTGFSLLAKRRGSRRHTSIPVSSRPRLRAALRASEGQDEAELAVALMALAREAQRLARALERSAAP